MYDKINELYLLLQYADQTIGKYRPSGEWEGQKIWEDTAYGGQPNGQG